jgi:hypothetical protein
LRKCQSTNFLMFIKWELWRPSCVNYIVQHLFTQKVFHKNHKLWNSIKGPIHTRVLCKILIIHVQVFQNGNSQALFLKKINCWFYLVVHNKFNTLYFILVLCISWTKLIQQMIFDFNWVHCRWNQTQSYLDGLNFFGNWRF